ncbi:amidase, putative [Macrophomina phaseolina MS6]|uniref:Amidase, putative n=1 Tax=Macrophomina phaseolina (strain MS6) TaxID=1126212 RepID=K2RHM8_MACPH|nr:amidase, putative [Macrophomina phaseolina MS6]
MHLKNAATVKTSPLVRIAAMPWNTRWPSSVVAAIFFTAFSFPRHVSATQVDGGKITTLDNIPFYVGETPVAQFQQLPSEHLGEAFYGQDIFPLTVIHAKAGECLSVQEYNSAIAGYKDQDDVFQYAFLQAIYIVQGGPNNVTAPLPGACASFT